MPTTVRLFGPPQISVDANVVQPPQGKTEALLYYLAFRSEWVSRDELTFFFWPEADERAARANLRQLLSTLRRLPYVTLETDDARVRWLVASDVAAFNAAYAQGARAAAVAAYTGPLLQGFVADAWPDFDAWLELTRAQLAARFIHEALALADSFERTGRTAEALTTLARAHELEPLQETILRAYLQGLYGAGQPGRARAAFETFKHALMDAVSGEPEAETTALVETLSGTAGPSPLTPHNLPLPRTTFVGREPEQAALKARLNDPYCRLLTVVGPGGIGKTRLSLEVAASLIGTGMFPDGVFFVPLASVSEAELLLPSIADALRLASSGIEGGDGPLTGYLRDKVLLLLLDNLEQLTGAAVVVADMLDACPRLKLLVTSREALGVYGEREYPVPALSLPDLTQLGSPAALRHYEAVEVFVQRAQDVQPDFALTPENAPAVAELCHRLDGLPLALELAAARVRLFSPQALAARMGRRLHVLTAGARTLPRRQQTLRDAISWSFDLLSLNERVLFRRLAVFVGGRSLEAIEAVCTPEGDDTMGLVDSLVRKNLLKGLPGADGEPRIFMLETIQEFAAEKLEESGEVEQVRQAHARYFLTLAQEGEVALRGPEQARWLVLLETEHDNFRAALRWAGEYDPDLGLELASALYPFWDLRSYLVEGRAWLEVALDRGGEQPWALRAKALNAAGVLARMQGDTAASHALLGECLSLYQRLGEREKIAAILNNLAITAENQLDLAAARDFFERALSAYRQAGARWGEASVLNNLGNVVSAQDGPEAARPLFEASLGLFRELGDARSVAMTLGNLGQTDLEQGDHVRAGPLLREATATLWQLGDSASTLYLLELTAANLTYAGEAGRAAQLYGATTTLRETTGIPLEAADQGRYNNDLAATQRALSREAWDEAYAAGGLLTLEAAVTLVLARG